MSLKTRKQQWLELFPDEPDYRFKQIETALFAPNISGWGELTTIAKVTRQIAEEHIPWISIKKVAVYESKEHDTYKAILETTDKKQFESVLMQNRRDQWTICVSSQVGCAMRCTFCATGTMGLKRSLTSDEIADQYRFWQTFLAEKKTGQTERISNVVFMGMGEPMANYANVKEAIHTWLRATDIGPTHITVSTVGVLSQLEKLLTDPDWPSVRVAISLHSANQQKREEIVPTTVPNFLLELADWSKRYNSILGNRRHHITYEYTVLHGINDTVAHAKELSKYIRTTGVSKVNIIPYNPVPGKPFVRSQVEQIDAFKQVLRDADIDVTQRKTMGDDIAAACGQLVTQKQAEKNSTP